MASFPFSTSTFVIGCLLVSVLCDVRSPIIKSLHIKSEIKYTYAKTLVTSRVLNPANVSQEVNFRVVLPENAFITGFVMTIKGKPYEAYIKEKEEAKKDYDAAVSSGQSAGLVSQTNSRYSKDFTVAVNVEPEEKVSFNLTYEELLTRKNRTYKNEFNINPQQIVSDLSIVCEIEDALNIKNVKVPQFKMSNEITDTDKENTQAKKEILSPKKVRVEWSPSEAEQKELNSEGLNGQMVVKYDVDASNNPQQILVDEDGYFVHILRNDDLPVLNKHVIFVLDVSGSMYGNKIDQLKQAMEKILSDLSEKDYFSMVLFSVKLLPWQIEGVNTEVLNDYYSSVEPISVTVKKEFIVPASKNNIDLALKFTKNLSTYGGTNINGGLRVGAHIAKLGQEMFQNASSPVEPMIIFLTDGEPNAEESNPDKIIENVDKINTGKVTIFSLGFGFDADMKFLKKLSLANNGFSRRIYEGSDAALQLNNFYKEVASPVMTDVKIKYLPDQVEDTTAEDRNLFSGSEILVLGKVKPNKKVAGELYGITPGGMKSFPIPIDYIILPPKVVNHTYGYLEKMWAYKTIKSLLDQNTVSKNDTIEKKAKDLALKYKFVTPLTSLVVVKPNVSSVVDDQLDGSRPSYGAHFAPQAVYGFAGAPGSQGVAFSTLIVGGIPPPMAPGYMLPSASRRPYYPTTFLTTTQQLTTTANMMTIMEVAEDAVKEHTKVPYTSVSWLNQTQSEDGLFLQPPPEVDQNDVIALNETDVSRSKCANGSDCRHFIFCALDTFANDPKAFLPFKCHIDPKFLGVCCPL